MTLKYYNNLAYEELGQNNNKIMLFLHPKLVSKWIWKKQIENYEKYFNEFHCIFLDLPNHGKSKTDECFSIENSSDLIIKFIENKLEIKKGKEKNAINIVGIGLGGLIAIEILNKKPELIDSIILSGLEITKDKENKENSVINRLGKTKSEYLNIKPDTFIVKAYLRHFGIKKEFFNDMKEMLNISIQEEKEIAFESLNYKIPESLKRNNKLLEKENMLLVYGNKEDLTSTYSAIKLNQIFKNSKLIEIEKGNHLWNIIDYDLFNQILFNFIKEEKIIENNKIKLLK